VRLLIDAPCTPCTSHGAAISVRTGPRRAVHPRTLADTAALCAARASSARRSDKDTILAQAGAEPEPEPEPEPEFLGGALELVVMQARGLTKMDRFGENDPYVTLKVPMYNAERGLWGDGLHRRTVTLEGGGAAPVWGHGEGQAFGARGCSHAPRTPRASHPLRWAEQWWIVHICGCGGRSWDRERMEM
jgi:hypothetical protein